jgi:hypothetical protein
VKRTSRNSATGILVVRAWVEPEQADGFRARLLGIDHDDPNSYRVVNSTAQAIEAIGRWLDEFVRRYSANAS